MKKVIYEVLENGKPAILAKIGMSESEAWPWQNNKFSTFEEALRYAKSWLGQWDCLEENWDGSPIDYDGYGDLISITPRRTEKTEKVTEQSL